MRRAGRSRARRSVALSAKAPHRAPAWAWTLGTWFGSGLSPLAPGTAGTAATLPLAYFCSLLPSIGPWDPWCLIAAIILIYPAVLAATHIELALGKHDPGAVVVDESLGTLLTLAFVPAAALRHWPVYAAAFFLFRLLDIWKPGLIGQSQALPKGWGIVIDDVLAGLLGGALLAAACWGAPALWTGLG